MSISALQVTGISPSGSRSCDYISSPCIYAFRTTLYFFLFLHGKFQIQYNDEGEVKSGVVDIADIYFSQKSDYLYLMNISSKKK